jgi:flagellar hook-associated protein 3 FlgL
MLSRISTNAYYTNVITDYGKSQADLATLNQQISSGKKATTFQGLHGSVERVNAFENKLKNTNQYIESNTLVGARLQVMGNAVDDVAKLADDVLKLIMQSKGANAGQFSSFMSIMEANINQVAAQLNTNIGGSYLFGGGKTATPPVKVPVPDNAAIGIPDSRYYDGNDEVTTARVTDTLLLDYGIKASDDGFQKLFAAMKTAVEAYKTGNQPLLEQALGLANQATEGVNVIKSRINGNIVILQDANTFHESTKAYVSGVYGEAVSTDTVAASVELSINNSVLQASFQAFSRITGLNLSDFLR